jgi:hypothetical protein
MHVYKPEVNNFVFGAYRPMVFGTVRTAGLSFHMGPSAKLSFQVKASGGAGRQKSADSGRAAAKVWFQSWQNYGSRHKEQQPPPAHEEEQESTMSADVASLAQGV